MAWFLKKNIFILWFVCVHWYLYHVHVDTQTCKITITSYDSAARTKKIHGKREGGPQCMEKKNTREWLEEFVSYSLQAAARVSERQFHSALTSLWKASCVEKWALLWNLHVAEHDCVVLWRQARRAHLHADVQRSLCSLPLPQRSTTREESQHA